MLEEENKKETQESEQVPAAERIQEPEAVQSQESEPAQDQTPNPVRESAGHSRRRQGEDKSQNLRFGVIAAGVVIALAVAAFAGKSLLSRQAEPELQRMGRRQHQSFRRTRHPKSPERRRSKRKKQW